MDQFKTTAIIVTYFPDEQTIIKTIKSIMKQVSKLLIIDNTPNGGNVFIGISNSGKVLGVEIGKDTIERLVNQITQNTDPKIQPHITTDKGNNKQIIIVKVKESSDHLALAFGRPYKRVGKSTLRMPKDEYERLILDKHKDKLYFDSQICKEVTLKDIDNIKVKRFLERASFERRLEINPNITPEEALRKLNLIKKDKLINAAILLFGKTGRDKMCSL
jgi:ATP-dependent DNA helicase RecG